MWVFLHIFATSGGFQNLGHFPTASMKPRGNRAATPMPSSCGVRPGVASRELSEPDDGSDWGVLGIFAVETTKRLRDSNNDLVYIDMCSLLFII